jgi:hypothetical protein
MCGSYSDRWIRALLTISFNPGKYGVADLLVLSQVKLTTLGLVSHEEMHEVKV